MSIKLRFRSDWNGYEDGRLVHLVPSLALYWSECAYCLSLSWLGLSAQVWWGTIPWLR